MRRALTVGLCAFAVRRWRRRARAPTATISRSSASSGRRRRRATFNDPTDPVRADDVQEPDERARRGHRAARARRRPTRSATPASSSRSRPASRRSRNNADFWQKGVENVSSSFLPTISVMARKGIWLPLPGFEIGAGATKLIDSNMYARAGLRQAGAARRLPRLGRSRRWRCAARSRACSARSQVDLTVVSVDATVSKSFGIAGTVTLDPYLGADALLDIVRGQVIDTTPNVDAFARARRSIDLNANTTFPDPDTILRWRIFAGFRLRLLVPRVHRRVRLHVLQRHRRSDCGKTRSRRKISRPLRRAGADQLLRLVRLLVVSGR